jgi:thiopeptide-type bacteriocin biosynthesis protein
VEPSTSPRASEKAILAVLAGTPLSQAAADILMDPADLADAVELYQAAGYAALQTRTARSGWYQVRIMFADWDTAEQSAAAHLWPELQRAETAGIISSWWFIRKAPCWRLRCQPAPAALSADMKAHVTRALDQMLSRCLITPWQESIYEPETHAFGGPEGIGIAHHLFHADSRGVLGYARQVDPIVPGGGPGIGRRELSILLCSLLMRGAGQDWYEQGDTWNQVQATRPLPPGTPFGRLREIRPIVRRLMTVDTEHTGTLVNGDGPSHRPQAGPPPSQQRARRWQPRRMMGSSAGACATSWPTTSSSTGTASACPSGRRASWPGRPQRPCSRPTPNHAHGR